MSSDVANGGGDADRPVTVDSLKSQRLISELDEIHEIGFSRKQEINPSVIVREEVEEREKTRESKISELAASVGSTAKPNSAFYDEDLEGLD